jgi:phosphotransferase system, enzyme I, PtsP
VPTFESEAPGVEKDRLARAAAPGGPRQLLRRLREIMAEPISPQDRLDKIVVLIAANMVAEVCSVYVLRADGRLELFATEGLNREAVHLTTMRKGEGLVGLIAESAEPLALADAQHHPSFSYRPETGEEIYSSFLGVPILRGGNTLGVLVVQNRARRVYLEEEMEALQTTAMLLAEMVASGELQAIGLLDTEIALNRPVALKGVPIAEGVGLGYVVLHEPRVTVKQLVAEDVKAETERLETAIGGVRESIDKLIERGDLGHGEHREVLEAFRMFAYDRGWIRRLREAVATGLTAEAAVERVQSDARARLQRQTDPYLRERLHDLDDLANRLLYQLAGRDFVVAQAELPENAIIVARTMGPAALLDYDRAKVRGIILEDAGLSSHVAIVARALGIATVGEVANILAFVEPGDAVIVDGSTGDVQVRPPPDVENAYAEKARLRARRQEQYHKLRNVPCVTKDGVAFELHMNAGLLVDLRHAEETGATSIGLFRTELQFMIVSQFPRIRQQYDFYTSAFEAVPGKPITFRTLDIGSDKVLPYMTQAEEENPALGWRAIRISLDRPALLRMQLRALLRAGADRDVRIMFPMVAIVDEFERAKDLALREVAYLKRHGYGVPRELLLGAMLEVPALLWQLDEICTRADFLSVGTNDLIQYMFAADRENKHVSSRFDSLSPPLLRALRSLVETAARHDTPLTLCGEMGGLPLEALALLAIGFRKLSMSPSSIGPVKAALLAADLAKLKKLVNERIDANDGAKSIREVLLKFAVENSIPV